MSDAERGMAQRLAKSRQRSLRLKQTMFTYLKRPNGYLKYGKHS
ncbi:hypothetical protein JCM19232_4804 [Vibrio ishigakensis]|uniref:Uncharacterized protein n=1 Tax=Vibrio ishigakensis TaxID=1481914 RepID=A0A0B8PEP5_9VIBR|nr:hypothetical protein JCM19232_4804 [Vibrio ishigakensis]